MSYLAEGEILKTAREKANLTQREVSDAFSFTSPQFISNCERGLCQLPAKHFPKLSKLVGRPAVHAMIDARLTRIRSRLRKGV